MRAAADTAAEGTRVAMVSHSAISTDSRFDGIVLRDVAVSVIDDDQPELLVAEIDPSTTNEDYSTKVLEGGFTDTSGSRSTVRPTSARRSPSTCRRSHPVT